MKRRMEVSEHCWKFIYKHSDISIFAVCHLFYFFYNFFYLHRCEKNIITNKFSSSGIYRYFNSSVRKVKEGPHKSVKGTLIILRSGSGIQILQSFVVPDHKAFWSLHFLYCCHLSLVTRKPVFRVFDQVRLKQACAATEAS